MTNYNNSNIENEVLLARTILDGTGISILDAVRFVKNALDFKPSRTKLSSMQFCTKIISVGVKHLHIKEMPIAKGYKEYLDSKKYLRPASFKDLRYLGRRLFRENPRFAKMNFSELSLSDCKNWLSSAFKTAPQFNKAHRFLNGLFNYAMRQEWLDRNVVKLVPKAKVIENEIKALDMGEVKALLQTSMLPKYRDCRAGLGLLLWAGLRPEELSRLRWQDIDLDEDVISVNGTTSKTGGARHIEICKPLRAWLKSIIDKNSLEDKSLIISLAWLRKWRALRKEAGFSRWTQDVLRHTYASYHIKHYHDLSRLQLNMGHSSTQLLRTRYLNLKNISRLDAKKYFSYTIPS